MMRKRSLDIASDFTSLKRSKVLFDSTNISPPVTPEKKRVLDFDIKSDENKSAVKQLFPSPPTTPTKPKSSIYSRTKAIFQRGHRDNGDIKDDCLVARQDEGTLINQFIKSSISSNICNSLYISGPPGCGKTAQLDLSINAFSSKKDEIKMDANKCKIIKINCMVLMNPQDIFQEICRQLNVSKEVHEVLIEGVAGYSSVMIILDEIDYLLTRDQEVLFRLFKLSERKNSHHLKTKLIMIGISNSLDLTDVLLPKLEKNSLSPRIVNFKPYSFDKMRLIVTEKLKRLIELDKENIEESFVPLVNPSAILLCCKKVSSSTGDLRRCFDFLYRSIELLEKELREKNDDPCKYDIMTAPRVSISHIAKACNLNYGNSILDKLSYLQQIIIIYLLKSESTESSVLTVNGFYDYYKTKDLTSHKIVKVKKPEFLEILTNLESLSMVVLSGNKNMGFKQVQSNVSVLDFKKSVSNIDHLRRILESI